jgi:hypothetical protein
MKLQHQTNQTVSLVVHLRYFENLLWSEIAWFRSAGGKSIINIAKPTQNSLKLNKTTEPHLVTKIKKSLPKIHIKHHFRTPYKRIDKDKKKQPKIYQQMFIK